MAEVIYCLVLLWVLILFYLFIIFILFARDIVREGTQEEGVGESKAGLPPSKEPNAGL